MVAAKKLAAVTAVLCLVLGVIFGLSAGTLVHAEEAGEPVVPYSQFEMANTAGETASAASSASAQSGEQIEFVQDELPMAEAKVSVLETHTEHKGMPRLLGFVLVAGAAAVAGIAVALRAKLGSKKRSYVPAEDMTLLKMKK